MKCSTFFLSFFLLFLISCDFRSPEEQRKEQILDKAKKIFVPSVTAALTKGYISNEESQAMIEDYAILANSNPEEALAYASKIESEVNQGNLVSVPNLTERARKKFYLKLNEKDRRAFDSLNAKLTRARLDMCLFVKKLEEIADESVKEADKIYPDFGKAHLDYAKSIENEKTDKFLEENGLTRFDMGLASSFKYSSTTVKICE